MLKEIKIQNYRSIRDSKIKLSPFTLLIGANGTGKSNLLKLLQDLSNPFAAVHNTEGERVNFYKSLQNKQHIAYSEAPQVIEVSNDKHQQLIIQNGSADRQGILAELQGVGIFSLIPKCAGDEEKLSQHPTVREDGQGIVRVLDSLKTGDREDLFNKIEAVFKEHIPEIEKLSFIPGNTTKQLQVREKHIPQPVKVSELSEGTQLALQLITLLHQERKPSLICIEDIDKGLHPRLFQKIVQLCFDLTAEDNSIQIIATTHNPYLVDEFKGHESAVVIVEKTNGETTFTTLEDKLKNLDPGEEPLGSLWYSGFVGGVPQGV